MELHTHISSRVSFSTDYFVWGRAFMSMIILGRRSLSQRKEKFIFFPFYFLKKDPHRYPTVGIGTRQPLDFTVLFLYFTTFMFSTSSKVFQSPSYVESSTYRYPSHIMSYNHSPHLCIFMRFVSE
jgi:hypothetical protein